MATEQDHVWAMLDDMLVFLSKRHVPTPERTYKLDGGWTLAMDDLRKFVDGTIAELTTLRAEVERLRGEIGARDVALSATTAAVRNDEKRRWKASVDTAIAAVEAAPEVGA